MWDDVFRAAGRRYEKPTLVLFTKVTRSACGLAQAVMGPFYCPEDRKIYLDLSFFEERERPSPCIADTCALLLWQFIEFVGCHIHLNGIADVVELIIGDRDHVAIQTENATDFDRDGDFAAESGQHAMDRTKVASV